MHIIQTEIIGLATSMKVFGVSVSVGIREWDLVDSGAHISLGDFSSSPHFLFL